jgi:hypothetical protein
MLITLSQEQLDTFAPIGGDGSISIDSDALASVLSSALGSEPLQLAITSVDYDQHTDGTPEPNTRTVKGIAWTSLGDNRCHKWSFRSDGPALSTTDEGTHPCPISEDADLVARAIIAIADSYPETVIDERNNRLTVLLPSGETKKARVVVIHDPRVIRAEDVLENDLELIAFRAGTLGVAIVHPIEGGQAVVRKVGLD